MPENSTEIIEQQIARLQRQLAETRTTLEQQGVAFHEMPSDREIIHSAVGEQIQQQIPSYTPAPPIPSAASPLSDDTPSYLTPELNEQVQQLVNLAFTKGTNEAIKMLSQMRNDALLDAFHDVIVDQFIHEMIQRKLIEEVK